MAKEPVKFYTPKDGMPVTIRFVDDPNFHHIRPQSIGGPDGVFKIPATKETVVFFKKEMAKAQHNKMVMDRHGLKPEDMFDEEKLKKHGITTVQNF